MEPEQNLDKGSLALYRLGKVEELAAQTARNVDNLATTVASFIAVQQATIHDRKWIAASVLNLLLVGGTLIAVFTHHA